MKKFFFVLFILILTIQSIAFAELDVKSPFIALIDASNGRVIYERDGYIKTYPASTTKIMTAILTFENANLTDIVTASENAINSVPSGGSTASIVAGEKLSVEDLLKATLIVSGNEAANILAEHVSGSIEAFVEKMNKRALELGCKNTHFVNPNGLHDEDHYSCAYDICLMYQYAYNNFPKFKEIVSSLSLRLPETEAYPKDDRVFKNSNKLLLTTKSNDGHLYYYEYCTGGKTGYTSQAKNCLVSSAKKDDITLIACVLGATQSEENLSYRFQDSINLYDYGFGKIVKTEVVHSGDVVKTMMLENAKDPEELLEIVTSKDVIANIDIDFDRSNLQVDFELSGDIMAPIEAGQVLGKATYTVYNEKYPVPLVAKNSIEEKPKFTILDFLSGFIVWGLRVVVVLIIIEIILRIIGKNSKKGKNQRIMRVKKYNQRFRR